MVDWNQVFIYAAGVGGLILGLGVIMGVFYLISELITGLGAFVMFLGVGVVLSRLLVRFILFPGSFRYWYRPIVRNYSKVSVYALGHQTSEFCRLIENLKSDSKGHLCFNLITALESFNHCVDTLRTLKYSNALTNDQKNLLTILQQIQSSFHSIRLTYSDQSYSLSEWYTKMPCGLEKCEFVKDSLSVSPNFIQLEKFLTSTPTLFSTLDFMRADLMNTSECKRYFLPMSDNKKIDCLWIPSGESEIAVILCNSNGNLYEFSSFQSDWVKFYLELGFSVFMWNYRGYGESQGRPSVERLKKDGENIVNFIRTEKLHIKVLGVHGESLGGCIAVHLAKECVLDFLVADRTFTCLRSVALFGYGKTAYWLAWLLRIDSYEYVGEYLAANCTKVIISDPNDKIIKDLASLKAGVAVRLLSHDVVSVVELSYLNPKLQANFNHIITYAAATSCVESLCRLQEFLDFFKAEKPQKKRHRYIPLYIDTEDLSTDNLASSIDRLLSSITNIEAGGKTILEAISAENPNLGLIVWLMVLDIWGSSNKVPEENVTSHIRSVYAIRNCLQEIQNVQEEYEKCEKSVVQEVFKDVNTIFNVLIEILGYMEERCGLSSNLDISIDRMVTEYACAGVLITVACGHLGSLSQVEKYQLSKYLLGEVSKGVV